MGDLSDAMTQIGGQLGAFWRTASQVLAPYVPRVLGAVLIVLAAWVGARVARAVVLRLLRMVRLEERLGTQGLASSLAMVASSLVWLLALPALLSTLQLEGLLGPVNTMMAKLLGFLPNLIGAVVVLGVGVFAARIVRQLVSGALVAAGSERLAAKLGLGTALGERTLAGVVGSMVFALVMLPTVAAALQPLGLDAVTQPVSRLLDNVMSLLPRLVSAALLLAVFALVGRVTSNLVTTVLVGVGFNKLPEHLGLSVSVMAGRSPVDLVGSVVMLGVMVLGVAQASEVLGFGLLTEAVSMLGQALSRVLVASVVLVLGLWLSAALARLVEDWTVPNARGLAFGVRAAVIFFAVALALRQAGLPAEIIAIAFGAVVIAPAVGLAVAMGVGGRHAMGRVLDRVEASFRHPPSGEGESKATEAVAPETTSTDTSAASRLGATPLPKPMAPR